MSWTKCHSQLFLFLSVLCCFFSGYLAFHHHQSPLRLLRCPEKFETLVLTLPPGANGDPAVLIAGPGVRLRPVPELLHDSALRVQGHRLLLTLSTDAAAVASPYSGGPHVLLCSDRFKALTSSFSLFIKLPPAASFHPSLLILTIALAACFATCLAVGLVLVALTDTLLLRLRRIRRRGLRCVPPGGTSGPYRDFRHYCASYRNGVQKR